MQLNDKLKDVLNSQKNLLNEYETLVKEFESSDIVNENLKLKKEVETYRNELDKLKKEYSDVVEQNTGLNQALKEQIMDERLNILKISQKKLNEYFKTTEEGYNNSIDALESKVKQKLEYLKDKASKDLFEEKVDFTNELNQFTLKLQEKTDSLKQKFSVHSKELLNECSSLYKDLETEKIDEDTIKRRIKQNNIEVKIGLNWINKIGIILILIGVATVVQYSYSKFFNNTARGLFAFLVGVILLGAGEFFNRKEKNVFALGLTGGGIGVMYVATFSSFFVLHIMSLNLAIFVSILITAAALTLSLFYNSRTICSLALTGGFMPIILTYVTHPVFDEKGLFIAMGYLFLLNMLTLLVSLYKKWDVVKYISFILNVPSLIIFVFSLTNQLAGVLYCLLTFGMYIVIILAYPYKFKIGLKILDIILLALNTVISCLITMLLFEKANLHDYMGALAILFCLIYLGLGKLTEKNIAKEKTARVLFYLTSYSFAILAVPFQLGIKWFAMGWLVEGVLMVIYGYKNRIKFLEIGGWIIFGLCLSGVLSVDFMRYQVSIDKEAVPHFHFRYLAVMLGLVSTLFIYLIDIKNRVIFKYSTRGRLITLLKYFTVANFWIFALFNTNSFFKTVLMPHFLSDSYYYDFFKTVSFSLVTIVVAYIIKIPLLYDRIIKIFSFILFALADIVCLFLTLNAQIYTTETVYMAYIAIAVIILFNIFMFFSIKDILIEIIREKKLSLEYYPLVLSIFLLYSVTAILAVQFNLGHLNLLFSILYLAASFLLVMFGFIKKYILTRRFGLGLSFFAIGKLFIYDLAFLDTLGKIIAYFVFGILLICISFAYQKLSKYIEITYKNIEKE